VHLASLSAAISKQKPVEVSEQLPAPGLFSLVALSLRLQQRLKEHPFEASNGMKSGPRHLADRGHPVEPKIVIGDLVPKLQVPKLARFRHGRIVGTSLHIFLQLLLWCRVCLNI